MRTFTQFFLLTVLWALTSALMSCAESRQYSNTELPVDWKSSLQLKTAVDTHPDPDIVEVWLTAQETEIELSPGEFTTMWTYNGQFPGPTIEAKVGDRLIVHLTNQLPEGISTTLHWHGVETPALMDGTPLSQITVPSAAQATAEKPNTFTYDFKLIRAATYWYHPHVNSAEQVERGLYGALVVRNPLEDQRLNLPTDELLIIADDILLDGTGKLENFTPAAGQSRANTLLNGRRGPASSFMLNGRNDFPTIKVKSGVPIRMRLINAANSQFFRFSIANHTLYRIGGDGGLVARPIELPPIKTLLPDSPAASLSTLATGKVSSRGPSHTFNAPYSDPDPDKGLLLVPGERADVMFTPIGNTGEIIYLDWHDFPRGDHLVTTNPDNSLQVGHDMTDGAEPFIRMLRMEFIEGSEKGASTTLPPANLRTIPVIDTSIPNDLPITFGHEPPDANGNVRFFASAVAQVPFAELTAQQGVNATIGQRYVWQVTNLSMGDHPFHTHGFSFQPLSVRYIDNDAGTDETVYFDVLEEKDTIRVPGRPGAGGSSMTIMRLAVHFDDSGRENQIEAGGKQFQPGTPNKSGGWLVHCHILEHASAGMGTFLSLSNPGF